MGGWEVVCVCACVCACMCACVFNVCAHARIFVRNKWLHVCVHVHVCTCVCACTRVCMHFVCYVRLHAYVRTCTFSPFGTIRTLLYRPTPYVHAHTHMCTRITHVKRVRARIKQYDRHAFVFVHLYYFYFPACISSMFGMHLYFASVYACMYLGCCALHTMCIHDFSYMFIHACVCMSNVCMPYV